MRSEICIVGGGPAGLAAALALAQSGREVTVLDCAAPPIDKACGEGLMPDSLAALSRLGIEIPDVGSLIRGIRFFGEDSCVTGDFPNGIGRGLRRVLLHEVLIARAEQMGIRMLWGVKKVQTSRGRVTFNGGSIDTDLIVGADGQKSSVRQQAGLHHMVREKRRYGRRKHYGAAPWSQYVEIYWGRHFQIYVTPVASDQVCVALLSTNPQLRLDAALSQVPILAEKLRGAPAVTMEKGSLSISRRFRRVSGSGYALIGDAAGSVDAITGEGMCLAFQQADALVKALNARNIEKYERSHRVITSKPRRMAALMLLLDSNRTFQRKALAGLAAHPQIFKSLLAAHVGNKPITNAISWSLIPFGIEVLVG